MGLREDERAAVERMAERAGDFLAALHAGQRQVVQLAFSGEGRQRWFYTPTDHGGIPLRELDPHQQQLAHRLLASGLSAGGYTRATLIMNLENVLDAKDGWRVPRGAPRGPSHGRDPGMYFVSVFGEPDGREWGWRFGGHHLSLNYTILDGTIASPAPLFFGANPAESPMGPAQTLRPLAGEEDLARELLHSLDDEQRARATLSPVAPLDIVQSNRPEVLDSALPLPISGIFNGRPPEAMARRLDRASQAYAERHRLGTAQLEALRYTAAPGGLPASAMSASQRDTFRALLEEYLCRMPDARAAFERERLGAVLPELHFAWAGGAEPRQPHYYRVQGPGLLVEFDNTQDDANHVHTVWREPGNDFGAGVLREHYAAHHRH